MKLTSRCTLAEVAMAVGDALRGAGIRGVLTGGACANVYTRGHYPTMDVDIVLSGAVHESDLDTALEPLGFRRDASRYVHEDLDFFVEFPRGPLAIGSDHRIKPIEYRVGDLRALMLSATDACRDRLIAFYAWPDRQSLETALEIAARNPVDLNLIRDWSEREGYLDKFGEFMRESRRRALRQPGRKRTSRKR